MSHPACDGCTYLRDSLSYDGKACYRAKSFNDGRVTVAPDQLGFPRSFETNPVALYDNRVEGDICGPDRIHWRAA